MNAPANVPLWKAILSAACGSPELARVFYDAVSGFVTVTLTAAQERNTVQATIIAAQREEITALRESAKRLHRRTQQAEAALEEFKRIMAKPEGERGIRFVHGSLGRSLLAWRSAELQRELETARRG